MVLVNETGITLPAAILVTGVAWVELTWVEVCGAEAGELCGAVALSCATATPIIRVPAKMLVRTVFIDHLLHKIWHSARARTAHIGYSMQSETGG
jgi:hypothetical protein